MVRDPVKQDHIDMKRKKPNRTAEKVNRNSADR